MASAKRQYNLKHGLGRPRTSRSQWVAGATKNHCDLSLRLHSGNTIIPALSDNLLRCLAATSKVAERSSLTPSNCDYWEPDTQEKTQVQSALQFSVRLERHARGQRHRAGHGFSPCGVGHTVKRAGGAGFRLSSGRLNHLVIDEYNERPVVRSGVTGPYSLHPTNRPTG